MNNTFKLMIVAVVAFMTACNSKSAYVNSTPKKEIDSVSYAVGLQIGQSMLQGGLDSTTNIDLVAKAIYDVLNNKKPLFGGDTLTSVIMKHFNPQAYTMMKDNETKGKKFFEENAKKPGVKTTASGLQYEVITEGTGPKPKASDEVTVDYIGSLLDGTEFDSSIKRGKPASFPLNGVIPGWTEGLQLMSVGSKYKLYIPGKLAYGAQGQQQAGIGPNETLVFDVELKSIDAPKEGEGGDQAAMQKMIQEAMAKQAAGQK